MVRPPSRGLVPPCLPLSPLVSHCLPLWHMCACVGRCVRLRRSCLPIVSLHMCACVGWCVCLRKAVLSPLVPRCLPMLPVTPHCLPVSPIVYPHVCHCWMVCSPSGGLPVLDGVSTFPTSCLPACLPLPPHMCDWLLLSSLASTCFPLSRIVSLLVSLCWMVCRPFRGLSPLVSNCLPLSPHMHACVEWCVRLCLSPILSPHVCLCCMVRPPS